MPMHFGRAIGLIFLAVPLGCGRFGAVYPSRPSPSPGVPAADPAPSRIVAHVAMSGASLRDALDGAVPRSGAGDFALLKSQRHYTWDRAPLDVSFSQGRVVLDARVHAVIGMPGPISNLEFPLELHVLSEPVVSTDYKVSLQSTEVSVTSSDRRLKIADHVSSEPALRV